MNKKKYTLIFASTEKSRLQGSFSFSSISFKISLILLLIGFYFSIIGFMRVFNIDNSSEKVQYNVNFLSKLVDYFKKINLQYISEEINNLINFDRKFEKWDTLNKAIILVAISELRNSEKEKSKIILNDYIEISKSFVNIKETKLINSILDKLINEKK